MIELMGGPTCFQQRLDYIFTPYTSGVDLGVNGLGITSIYNVANEPHFPIPYLYHYINASFRSVARTRALAHTFYHAGSNGILGNSDAGALNGWLVWQMLGLYPVVTTSVYLLGAPWFPSIHISVNHDRVLNIRAEGLDDGGTRGGYFVQGVRVNGVDWDRNWIEHRDVMVEGGEILFRLGSEARVWEKGSVPPSPGHR